MSFKKFSLALAVLGLGVSAGAQTGPAPLAEKQAIANGGAVKAKNIYDYKAAASIWNMRPSAKETTAAMEKRAKKTLNALLEKDPKKLNYDTDYWRLLAFLREVPIESMSKKRQDWYLEKMPNPRLTDEQRDFVLKRLENKKIFEMTPKEVDIYLSWYHKEEPDLRKRVVGLARKNLGQPYDIYLLGEFPHELYDPDPMFCLDKGDCVVFSEHMYSMALGHDWKSFYKNLMKIRYKNGEPGMTTRNHFTEADWDKNNSWLVTDVTNDLGATTVTKYTEKIDRARFFKNFGIGQDIPIEMLEDTYIPGEAIESVLPKLKDGDFVNIVRGVGNGVWVGHVGLIGHDKDGNVTFIHSTEPKSKEQPIMEYVNNGLKVSEKNQKNGRAGFKGMKFLRLNDEALTKKLQEESQK